MSLYWLYDLSTLSLFLLIIGVVAGIAVGGCLVLRERFDAWLHLSSATNSIVGLFLSFTGVFYGIILGLVAVGAWDSFRDTSQRAETEAASLGALYRDVTQFPEATRAQAQEMLRTYALTVMSTEWPDQRAGRAPTAGNVVMDTLARLIVSSPITSARDEVVMAGAFAQFNSLIEARRARIAAVSIALPTSLWFVLTLGTLIILTMTWMLYIENRALDVAINLLTGTLLGTVLAFVVAMDNPYRGKLSVGTSSYEVIYRGLMGGQLPGDGTP
jgi:Protein of unknown function (DUF4239)